MAKVKFYVIGHPGIMAFYGNNLYHGCQSTWKRQLEAPAWRKLLIRSGYMDNPPCAGEATAIFHYALQINILQLVQSRPPFPYSIIQDMEIWEQQKY
jgi:hypothetical protein